MNRRLPRDERGMAMSVTIMLVVVIGVLGAGLLVFVQRDLELVARFNGGVRAFGLADTGVQAARRELLETPFPESYDGATPAGAAHPESRWSFASSPVACGDLAEGPGRCVSTDEGVFRVSVRHLPPPTAASGAGSPSDPDRAPVPLPEGAEDYPDDREYFRVDSDGVAGDYRRRIQAIVVRGVADPSGEETSGAEGHYVRIWSWRECRDSACLRD